MPPLAKPLSLFGSRLSAATAAAWLAWLVIASTSPAEAEEAARAGREAKADAPLFTAAPPDPEAYEAVRAQLEQQRRQLAARKGEAGEEAARLDEAERALAHALVEEILPRWIGVRWRRGEASLSRRPDVAAGIHCASFVIAALEGAGLRFAHRDQLAQAPALRILEAIAAPDAGGIARWRGTVPALRRELLRRGPGVYLLGLTRHIGFAVVGAPRGLLQAADLRAAGNEAAAQAVQEDIDGRADEVWLVHASRGSGAVVIEPMVGSRAMERRHGTAIFVAPLVGGNEAERSRQAGAATGQATRDRSHHGRALVRRWLAGTSLGPS